MILTFAILAVVFLSFLCEWIAVDLAALGGLSLLLAAGILDEADLGRVFSNPAPITIGAMFILSEALNRTGAVAWLANLFSKSAGKSLTRSLAILALIVMPLSAFLNNTPVVVVFLPVLMAFCRRTGMHASKLLIPLSFLSILGGTVTLLGTSTNLLVAGVAKAAGQPAFGIFEITGLGLVFATIGFLYLYFIGHRLLPKRSTVASLLDAEDTRKFCSAVEISPSSTLVGTRLISQPLFSNRRRTIVYEVSRDGLRVSDIPLDALVLEAGDVLWFRATSRQLAEIRATEGLTMLHEKANAKPDDRRRAASVKTVEAIIGPASKLLGQSIRQSDIRRRYGVLVAAVHRRGANLRENYQDIPLGFGDTLLLEGPEQNLAQLREQDDFLTLNEAKIPSIRHGKVLIAIGILVGVILAATFGYLSISSAAIIGAVLTMFLGCVEPREAYRAVEWNILFLIYGMLGIGLALEKTGGAELLANGTVDLMESFGPVAILAAIYLLASILTEFITNNAVAILLTPIVISIATSLEIDARPFIVAIMFGASASFLTPIGYQTNTYVYGAGGYRFTDFLKIGLPLNLLLWVAATVFIPWIWPF